MVWIKIEDSHYYSNPLDLQAALLDCGVDAEIVKHALIKENRRHIFSKGDIATTLNEHDYERIIFSPFSPAHFELETSFFGVVNVPNRYGILTTSEKKAGMTDYEKLHKKLGLIVERSPFTFADMSGSQLLRDIANKLNIKYIFGEIPKAVFLAGIMGTGKTFFAQCLAGETDRLLVSFNLAKMMSMPNPLEAFDEIIDYLVKEDGKYVLWIDEIEKMFNGSEKSEHIKNKFLTFLNDLGLTIKMDAFVVITANDVTDILTKNPEMVRSGRVEPFAKVYLDFLTNETAENIANLYITKRNSEKERKLRIAKAILAKREGRLPESLWINRDLTEYFPSLSRLLDESSNLKEKDLEEKLLENLEQIIDKSAYNKMMRRLMIPIEPRFMVDFIDRAYRVHHSTSKLTSFPYVPAEIKEIISQIFYYHMDEEIGDNRDSIERLLTKLIKENISVGDAGSVGVGRMQGNRDKFSVIVN